MHNHDGKNGRSMMWMVLPCLLLVAMVFFGGGNFVSSRYLWLIIVGACLVPHVWMLFKGHGVRNNTDTEDTKHKHGGCCH